VPRHLRNPAFIATGAILSGTAAGVQAGPQGRPAAGGMRSSLDAGPRPWHDHRPGGRPPFRTTA